MSCWSSKAGAPEHSHILDGDFFLLSFAIGEISSAMAASVTELCTFWGVFKCQPSTDEKPNLVLLEPPEMHQIKAPDSKVISFMMSSFLELRSSSEPDEHFGRRDNF